VVVNWWNEDSLARLRAEERRLVEIHCECDQQTARDRFESRRRHPGHHDDAVSPEEREDRASRLRATWTGAHGVGPVVRVDTTVEVDLDDLVAQVLAPH
jgi:predicted kinase